jgi:4-carboxymuconolactone decarboxylase
MSASAGEARSKRARLARLFTALVLGRWDSVRELRRAAPAGEPDRAWRETLLQAHVFAGFPRVVEALSVLDDLGGWGEAGADERLGEAEQPERGRALFERIYADNSERVREFLVRGHADFADWIEGHAYGRVLSRPGLAAAERELLAVCGLAALRQERQLASHLRGAMRCGAELADIEEALGAARDLIGAAACDEALRVAERLSAREAPRLDP